MKVSLEVDEQQSQTLGTQVYVMNLDESAKVAESIIRKAVKLKASIEKAGNNWDAETMANDIIKLGIPVPISRKASGDFVLPADLFAEMIVSPFYDLAGDNKMLVSVSANLVSGAPWQGHAQKSRAEAVKLFKQFDEDTKVGGTSFGALAHWHKPFPFFHAGEGKNRVSLAQAYDLPYLAQAFTWKMVEANTLTIRKVWFSKHWVLQCSDKTQRKGDFPAPFRLKDGEFLIPFPHLTVKLLKEYGVRQKSSVFRLFIGSRFKHHMLRFLSEKCYGTSPWR